VIAGDRSASHVIPVVRSPSSREIESVERQHSSVEEMMVTFVCIGSSLMSIAAGICTLATKRLPPIFLDGKGGRGAPDIEPAAVPQWGAGFLVFGAILGAVSYASAFYTRAA
jgi:hypothetical protein